jgi:hypothetical protein
VGIGSHRKLAADGQALAGLTAPLFTDVSESLSKEEVCAKTDDIDSFINIHRSEFQPPRKNPRPPICSTSARLKNLRFGMGTI